MFFRPTSGENVGVGENVQKEKVPNSSIHLPIHISTPEIFQIRDCMFETKKY
jgi:hypothetical protein